jgi:hypothetical protein
MIPPEGLAEEELLAAELGQPGGLMHRRAKYSEWTWGRRFGPSEGLVWGKILVLLMALLKVRPRP